MLILSLLAPSEPRNTHATADKDFFIKVRWDAPASDGGGTITKYQVKIVTTALEDSSAVSSDINLYDVDAVKKPKREKSILLSPYVKVQISVREGGGDKPVWGEFGPAYTFDMPEGGLY